MTKITILGSGAAPGVPSVSGGWGCCNPLNPKNRRFRTGTYIELNGTKILIDTSPDIRLQLLNNSIKAVDGILYTHAHADHLHGIDDLRELNRISQMPIDIYADFNTAETIRTRFPYLLTDREHLKNSLKVASLVLHEVTHGQTFYISGVPVMPIELAGHNMPSTGYIINEGEIVYIADCKQIVPQYLDVIVQKRPKLLILPLTTFENCYHEHMGLEVVLEYVKLIKAEKTVINHMARECDYDEVNKVTPENVVPAFDGMFFEI